MLIQGVTAPKIKQNSLKPFTDSDVDDDVGSCICSSSLRQTTAMTKDVLQGRSKKITETPLVAAIPPRHDLEAKLTGCW